MLIFTTVSSSCSAPISASTGATWRHGPHQGAQKSTSTGLSDFSTSASNVASVTALVDFISDMGSPGSSKGSTMGPAPKVPAQLVHDLVPVRHRLGAVLGGCGEGALTDSRHDILDGGQVTLRVDRGLGSGCRRRDRLHVLVVDHVTAGEHPGHVRLRSV